MMQHLDEDPLDPTPTVRWAIHFGRQMTGRSFRQIATISGVSAGQVSRLANGHSDRPSVETTVALAPALGIHPTCLLVLAGHVQGESARKALTDLVEHAAESIEQEYDGEYLAELRARLRLADGGEAIRSLATL